MNQSEDHYQTLGVMPQAEQIVIAPALTRASCFLIFCSEIGVRMITTPGNNHWSNSW
jgi:hypothetical protein